MRFVQRYHVSTIAYFSIFYYPFFIHRNMELIERATFLTSLQLQFEKVVAGEGHCVFVSGEAGIGKLNAKEKGILLTFGITNKIE